jgi:hypothetical protein
MRINWSNTNCYEKTISVNKLLTTLAKKYKLLQIEKYKNKYNVSTIIREDEILTEFGTKPNWSFSFFTRTSKKKLKTTMRNKKSKWALKAQKMMSKSY